MPRSRSPARSLRITSLARWNHTSRLSTCTTPGAEAARRQAERQPGAGGWHPVGRVRLVLGVALTAARRQRQLVRRRVLPVPGRGHARWAFWRRIGGRSLCGRSSGRTARERGARGKATVSGAPVCHVLFRHPADPRGPGNQAGPHSHMSAVSLPSSVAGHARPAAPASAPTCGPCWARPGAGLGEAAPPLRSWLPHLGAPRQGRGEA